MFRYLISVFTVLVLFAGEVAASVRFESPSAVVAGLAAGMTTVTADAESLFMNPAGIYSRDGAGQFSDFARHKPSVSSLSVGMQQFEWYDTSYSVALAFMKENLAGGFYTRNVGHVRTWLPGVVSVNPVDIEVDSSGIGVAFPLGDVGTLGIALDNVYGDLKASPVEGETDNCLSLRAGAQMDALNLQKDYGNYLLGSITVLGVRGQSGCDAPLQIGTSEAQFTLAPRSLAAGLSETLVYSGKEAVYQLRLLGELERQQITFPGYSASAAAWQGFDRTLVRAGAEFTLIDEEGMSISLRTGLTQQRDSVGERSVTLHHGGLGLVTPGGWFLDVAGQRDDSGNLDVILSVGTTY